MKSIIKIGLIIALLILIYLLAFPKRCDKYSFGQLIVKKVMLIEGHDNYKIQDYKENSNYQRLGLLLNFDKDYCSNKSSPRQLFLASQEPGLEGILNISDIQSFNVSSITNNDTLNLNQFLCLNIIKGPSKNLLTHDLDTCRYSLKEFIEDVINNERKTSGIRLDKTGILFLLKNKNDSLLNNELDVEMDNCIIKWN